jgi:hypothetical protein
MPWAAVGAIAAVASAGAGIAGAAGAFNGDAEAPAARDLSAEAAQSLKAQIDLEPERYAASAKYDPLRAQLKTKSLQAMLEGGSEGPGMIQTYDELLGPWSQRVTTEANTATRKADVTDVRTLGPGMVDAIDAADPASASMRKTLTGDVFAELMSGDQLSPLEKRNVQQAARAAAASRGMGSGQSAALEEATALALTGQALKDKRRAAAASMLGLNKNLVGDPMLMVTGRSSGATGVGANMLGTSLGTATGASGFDPFNAYAQDVNSSNYNAGWSSYLNQKNVNAARQAGGMSLIGSGLSGIGSYAMSQAYNQSPTSSTVGGASSGTVWGF